MSSPTLVAVPITSAVRPLTEQVQTARAAGADLVELRVDCIGDVAAVEALLTRPRVLPCILTIRSAMEGGVWSGSEAERIALYERLGLLQPGYVDVEYATWQRSANIRQKIALVCETQRESGAADSGTARPRNRLILSRHDLAGVPADLDAAIAELAASPAGIIKLVVTADDATDGWRVLDVLRRHSAGRAIIALAMGEHGLASRVLARKFGAFLTFAALEVGEESAPGQPPLTTLNDIYGWRRITPATHVLGVVGWPVAHSLSPAVHNAAMRATGIDGVYVPLPVRPTYAAFAALMEQLNGAPWADVIGLSVTLPHKEHALRWLDEAGGTCSELARRCGAVNTLTREMDGRWEGDNTDAAGALAALASVSSFGSGLPTGLSVAVLGAGGVARAVVAGLVERACKVTVYNRTLARAERLARELRCESRPWESRADNQADVVINCTSIGMWPVVDETPMPEAALRAGTVVFDTVYRPAQTRLLRLAEGRGCGKVGGVAMFVGQAGAQFERWHGRTAPLEVMRDVMSQAVAGSGNQVGRAPI